MSQMRAYHNACVSAGGRMQSNPARPTSVCGISQRERAERSCPIIRAL
jgi:hypothetical protein